MKTSTEKFEEDFKELDSRILSVLVEGESSHIIVAVLINLLYNVCLQEIDPKLALEELERSFKYLRKVYENTTRN